MGNDGGSIPKRRELVKEAARNQTTTELKATQHEQQSYHWSTDPLTLKPLAAPIVSDAAGKLYNKDSIIEYLLPSTSAAFKAEADKTLLGGVRSLKDVVEVRFASEKRADGKEGWVCPVTRKTLGPGGVRAVYLVPCGHAFDASVVREIAEQKCLECGEGFAENDVIPIVPTQVAEIARLSLRVKGLREKGLTHSLKKGAKDKKRKKNGGEAGEKNGDGVAASRAGEEVEDSVPKLVPAKVIAAVANAASGSTAPSRSGTSTPTAAATGGIKNAATASLTARVLNEQEERNKRRKLQKNENLDSLFSSREQSSSIGNTKDFMTRGFTIPAQGK